MIAVLQCCAGDQRSICSAARAHSRLQQAAVVALSSITVTINQQQDTQYQPESLSLLLYVVKHRQHIVSFDLEGNPFISKATDSNILALLTKLRRLQAFNVQLKTSTLCQLQHLTRLVLHSCAVLLQPGALAALTQLQHLAVVQSKILSDSDPEFEDTAAAGTQQLLSDLQHLQQLTHLDLESTLPPWDYRDQPYASPEAYTALTASSRLQQLDISNNRLPAGVWEHIFPSDRQLPHLRTLDISWVRHPADVLPWSTEAPLPGALLASCCPGLQTLRVKGLEYPTEGLAPLQLLSSLRELVLVPRRSLRDQMLRLWREGQIVLPKLTGLRRLSIVGAGEESEGLLLQLTTLRQLTRLTYIGRVDGADVRTFFWQRGACLWCPPD